MTRAQRISTDDLLAEAWGIIANAGWDNNAKSPGWQEAAIQFRERYFAYMGYKR